MLFKILWNVIILVLIKNLLSDGASRQLVVQFVCRRTHVPTTHSQSKAYFVPLQLNQKLNLRNDLASALNIYLIIAVLPLGLVGLLFCTLNYACMELEQEIRMCRKVGVGKQIFASDPFLVLNIKKYRFWRISVKKSIRRTIREITNCHFVYNCCKLLTGRF